MIRLRSNAIAAIAVLATVTMTSSCSSDSEGDGGVAQPDAATRGGGSLMLDTEEYKVKQEFPLEMELSSEVFNRIRRIPIKYTCVKNYRHATSVAAARRGEDKSPPLAWSAGPEGTKSFALIVDDPDAVEYETGVISPRVHWTIWNIPADVTELVELVPTTTELLSIGPDTRQGANDYHGIGWGGPCPPPNITAIHGPGLRMVSGIGQGKVQPKPHGYVFRVYALDIELDLAAGATKNDLLEAIDDHILGGGELRGEYVNPPVLK